MKIIRYKFLSCEVNHGTEENNEIEQIFLDKTLPWSEAGEALAMKEAENGEYSVIDITEEEAAKMGFVVNKEPSADDVINTLLGVAK